MDYAHPCHALSIDLAAWRPFFRIHLEPSIKTLMYSKQIHRLRQERYQINETDMSHIFRLMICRNFLTPPKDDLLRSAILVKSVLHRLPDSAETRAPMWLIMLVRDNVFNKSELLCEVQYFPSLLVALPTPTCESFNKPNATNRE